MIAAPFFHVGFADFWLADQLNSLVTALLDFQYLICFYFVNGDWLNAGSKRLRDSCILCIDNLILIETNIKIYRFRYIWVYGNEFHVSSDCKLFTGMVPICAVPAAIPWFTRSIPTFSECRQIFDNIFCCDFCHTSCIPRTRIRINVR